MSTWGHIAGLIRVDGMHLALDDDNWKPPGAAPVCLGKMTPDYDFEATYKMTEEEEQVYYENRLRLWKEAEDSGIPMGSEGSIKWEWYANRRGDIQYDGRYVFYGDLRDYHSDEPVFNWLLKIKEQLDAKNIYIRQISVQVEIEGKNPVFIGLQWDQKEQKDVLVKYETTENGMLLYAKT